MSQVEEVGYEVDEVGPVENGSLSARAKAARQQQEKQRTTIIDVSTYPNVLAIEYRVIGWQTVSKIRRRHERVRDEGLRELYIACDQLLAACETALEIRADGSYRSLGVPWGVELARLLGIEDLPEGCTPRQAMLAIFGVDSRVIGHWMQYVQWQQGENREIDEGVVRDFDRTA